MSDKFSQELAVSNLLTSFLTRRNFQIIQLVSPGSQATYSITYTNIETSKRKTVFPDLIAVKGKTIFIGEMKGDFSSADKVKLLNMKVSAELSKIISRLISRVLVTNETRYRVKYCLIHGNIQAPKDVDICQLILTAETELLLTSGRIDQ
ncbi:MAG: hypothetical protein EOO20_24050 [Chryseobacterium sp.]|nr:MAG: hypothetical protein EOO20_24050 [Chryseobacterium sp.]